MSTRIYRNGMPVWEVSLRSEVTDEKIHLLVTGETNAEATHKCVALLGYDGDYKWLGTGPMYE